MEATTVGEKDVKPDEITVQIKELNDGLRKAARVFEEAQQTLESERTKAIALVQSASSYKIRPISEERQKKIVSLDSRFSALRRDAQVLMEKQVKEAKRTYQSFVDSIPKKRQDERDAIDAEFQPRISEVEREHAMEMAKVDEGFDVKQAKVKEEFEKLSKEMKSELEALNKVREVQKEAKKKAKSAA